MKNRMRGWKDIFRFTLTQSTKSKSFRVTALVFFIVAFAAIPIIGILTEDDSDKKLNIEQLYICDNGTNIAQSVEKVIKENDTCKDIEIFKIDKNDVIIDELENADSDEYKKALINIDYSLEGMTITGYYGPESSIKASDVEDIVSILSDNNDKIIFDSINLDEERSELLLSEINYEVVYSDEDIADEVDVAEENVLTGGKYWFSYALLFVIMMIISFGSGFISESIISEKSNKMVELLLISVKPMAIVIGKVLAMLTAVIIQFSCLIIGAASSMIITGNVPDAIKNLFTNGIFENANPFTVVITLLIIFTGFLFFGFISALAGASVSKIEEMAEGVKLSVLTLIIGAYVGIAVLSMLQLTTSIGAFPLFAVMFPLSSPMLAPGLLLTGTVSIWYAVIALVILIIVTLLIINFTANVYEATIFYKGNPIGIKKMLSMLKDNNGGAKHE